MARALFHAESGRGRTTPNPIVGAVVVSAEGIVVGQGGHLEAGGPHAEIIALDEAGTDARGGTLYSTLEPCVHAGRTGPCVERIVAAGIRRVVAAAGDPNPRVAGDGFAFLRRHGVEVIENVERAAAVKQLQPFFTWMTAGRPFITLKVASTADRFVGRTGSRVTITGAAADRFFHRQRAEIDAIAVGANTLLADDPRLTARGAYRFRPLTRVIFDWRARATAGARVFSTLSAGPVIMIVLADVLKAAPGYLRGAPSAVRIEAFARRDLELVARRLGELEILSLLVEGGPALHEAFVAGRLVDRVQWVQSPDVLGDGIPMSAALTSWMEAAPAPLTVGLGRDQLREFHVHRSG